MNYFLQKQNIENVVRLPDAVLDQIQTKANANIDLKIDTETGQYVDPRANILKQLVKEIDDEFLSSKTNYPQDPKFTSYQTNSLLLFGYGVQRTWWRFTTLFTESCNRFLPQWYLRYVY